MPTQTFSIVITEKGGAERREGFEQTEVSIGRVKGNDVLLPKGNVSKRHARIILRDGRFIVTDLKSTNGTYINHRRITHATLVREGDRIYIGDFVLRVEPDGHHSLVSPLAAATAGFDHLVDSSSSTPGHVSSSSSLLGATHMPLPPDVVSHFPIEHDPDDSALDIDVPGPPRMPSAFQASAAATGQNPMLESVVDPLGYGSADPAPPPAAGASAPSSRSSHPEALEEALAAHQTYFARAMRQIEASLDLDELDAVVEPDGDLCGEVDAVLDRELPRLFAEHSPPEGLLEEMVRSAAAAELLRLGPLDTLLADEHVREVRVVLARMLVTRRGRETVFPGLRFSSERAIARALRRLRDSASMDGASMDGASMDGASMDGALTDGGAATTGEGPTRDELTEGTYVELTLPGRRTLFAVRPPAAPNGHMLVVRKLGVEQLSLNELVRNGTISRGMATLLAHCVAGRANLLVVGPDGAGSGPLVHALVASLGVRSSGALWLSTPAIAGALPAESPVLDMGDTVASRVRAIEATARLAPPHVVAPPLGGPALIALLDAITHGLQGAIVRATAPTLRQAMNRMAMDVASTRGHLDPDTARQWLASAFDLGLEVARLRDDRVRVVRLAELHPPGAAGGSAPGDLRDIFSFAYHRTAAGGSVEGAFSASGTVPRVVEDLGARGMPLDTSIFRRHPSG